MPDRVSERVHKHAARAFVSPPVTTTGTDFIELTKSSFRATVATMRASSSTPRAMIDFATASPSVAASVTRRASPAISLRVIPCSSTRARICRISDSSSVSITLSRRTVSFPPSVVIAHSCDHRLSAQPIATARIVQQWAATSGLPILTILRPVHSRQNLYQRSTRPRPHRPGRPSVRHADRGQRRCC